MGSRLEKGISPAEAYRINAAAEAMLFRDIVGLEARRQAVEQDVAPRIGRIAAAESNRQDRFTQPL